MVVGLGQRLFSSGVELEGKEPHYVAVLGSAKEESDEHVTSLSVLHHSEKGSFSRAWLVLVWLAPTWNGRIGMGE